MRVLSFWGIYWVSWLQSSLQSSHMTQQNFFEVVQNQRLWELEYDWDLQLCGSLMSEHHHHHLHFAGCLMGFKILGSRWKPTCLSHSLFWKQLRLLWLLSEAPSYNSEKNLQAFCFLNALWVLMFSKCSYPPKYTTNRLRFLCTVKGCSVHCQCWVST